MKRFLATIVAALAILAISQNKASAWSKCNFNIGLHFSREAADNSFLWGLYRSGPHPFASGPSSVMSGHGYVPDNPYQYYNPYPAAGGPATSPTLPAPAQSVPQAAAGTQYNGQNGTQPVGYWNSNYQYVTPANSNWTPPSYWYDKN